MRQLLAAFVLVASCITLPNARAADLNVPPAGFTALFAAG